MHAPPSGPVDVTVQVRRNVPRGADFGPRHGGSALAVRAAVGSRGAQRRFVASSRPARRPSSRACARSVDPEPSSAAGATGATGKGAGAFVTTGGTSRGAGSAYATSEPLSVSTATARREPARDEQDEARDCRAHLRTYRPNRAEHRR